MDIVGAIERLYAMGGHAYVVAALAVGFAYWQGREAHALRKREAARTARLLHSLLRRSGPRPPVARVPDDEETTGVISVRDLLTEQAERELSDVSALVSAYLADEHIPTPPESPAAKKE